MSSSTWNGTCPECQKAMVKDAKARLAKLSATVPKEEFDKLVSFGVPLRYFTKPELIQIIYHQSAPAPEKET